MYNNIIIMTGIFFFFRLQSPDRYAKIMDFSSQEIITFFHSNELRTEFKRIKKALRSLTV